MKKIVTIIAIAVGMCASVTSCALQEDKSPAITEIVTSTGKANIVRSYHGNGKPLSGLEKARTKSVYIDAEKGEIVKMHFFCTECKYESTAEVEAREKPYEQVFSCECPEEKNDTGNLKEYTSIIVRIAQNKEE